MLKKVLASLLMISCLACSTSNSVSRSPLDKPKSFVTPWEYYQKSGPAVIKEKSPARYKKAEFQSTSADTKSDKTQMIIVGTLVGVLVIGGTVAGVMLAK